jgi:hypothetical protein
MNERWKYQLKVGLFWGLFMLVFMTLFEWKEQPIMTQLSSLKFYVRLVVYLALGIFFVGYFSWKGKDPKNNSWSTFFGKKKE